MEEINKEYWDTRYQNEETGWDIGYASPAISDYFKSLDNTNVSVLIPGCGNAYEGEFLYRMGIKNVTLMDFSEISKQNFLSRVPDFPKEQFIVGDFFEHKGSYDYIVEQTFFCALDPKLRENYVSKMHDLIKPEGKLVGLMFNIPLFEDYPPFGGNAQIYKPLFADLFNINSMELSEKSIPQRQGNELFIELSRKNVFF